MVKKYRCPTCERMIEVRFDGVFEGHDEVPPFRAACPGSGTDASEVVALADEEDWDEEEDR